MSFRKLFFYLSVALVVGMSSAVTTRADLVIVSGNIPQTDENVLLNTGITGNPISGITNQTQTSVGSRQMNSLPPHPTGRRGSKARTEV